MARPQVLAREGSLHTWSSAAVYAIMGVVLHFWELANQTKFRGL
jgi:hypothetical protein